MMNRTATVAASTPAPWTKTVASHIGAFDVTFGTPGTYEKPSTKDDNQGVAIIIGNVGEHHIAEANAFLIAAAPDLLVAAKNVLIALEKADIATDALAWAYERDLLFDAIAKAEGRLNA